jgi:hypothetical protein
MQNVDHNIGFWEKRHFFRRKLSQIAENCDHNIDPGHPGPHKIGRIDEKHENWSKRKRLNFLKLCVENKQVSFAEAKD